MALSRLPVAFALLAVFESQAVLASTTRIENRHIENRQTLAGALHAIPLPDGEVEAIIGALKGVFDFRRSRPGDQLRIVLGADGLERFDYRQNALDEWHVRREGDRWMA